MPWCMNDYGKSAEEGARALMTLCHYVIFASIFARFGGIISKCQAKIVNKWAKLQRRRKRDLEKLRRKIKKKRTLTPRFLATVVGTMSTYRDRNVPNTVAIVLFTNTKLYLWKVIFTTFLGVLNSIRASDGNKYFVTILESLGEMETLFPLVFMIFSCQLENKDLWHWSK